MAARPASAAAALRKARSRSSSTARMESGTSRETSSLTSAAMRARTAGRPERVRTWPGRWWRSSVAWAARTKACRPASLPAAEGARSARIETARPSGAKRFQASSRSPRAQAARRASSSAGASGGSTRSREGPNRVATPRSTEAGPSTRETPGTSRSAPSSAASRATPPGVKRSSACTSTTARASSPGKAALKRS